MAKSKKRKCVAVQRLVRPCQCEYQKARSWGYRIYEWRDKQACWRPVISAATPEMAEILARDYKRVLISCLGCGADMVREYGPNEKGQR